MKKGNSSEGTLWSVNAGTLQAALTKLSQELGEEGAAIIEKLKTDGGYLSRTGRFLKRGGFDSYVHAREARAVLGVNYFGVQEWLLQGFGEFSQDELNQAAEFPWRIETLLADCPFHPGKKIKDTHFAFLGRPLIIAHWKRLSLLEGKREVKLDPTPHALLPNPLIPQLQWYLMLIDGVDYRYDTSKLSLDYAVPSACPTLMYQILYHLKNQDATHAPGGEKLHSWEKCGSHGDSVYVNATSYFPVDGDEEKMIVLGYLGESMGNLAVSRSQEL